MCLLFPHLTSFYALALTKSQFHFGSLALFEQLDIRMICCLKSLVNGANNTKLMAAILMSSHLIHSGSLIWLHMKRNELLVHKH